MNLRINHSFFGTCLLLGLISQLVACECNSIKEPLAPGEPKSAAPTAPAETRVSQPQAAPLSLRQAMLHGDYEQARTLLDEASEAEQAEREWMLARAFVALRLEETTLALRLLSQIKGGSSTVQRATLELQEEAARKTGDINLIELVSKADRDVESRLSLAEAQLANQNAKAAKREAEAILRDLKKKRSSYLPRCLLVLAQSHQALGENKSASALYWELLTEHPTSRSARDADLTWEKLNSKKISQKTRIARADALSDTGRPQDTEEELSRLAAAPAPRVDAARIEEVRAWAYYRSRSDYKKAAQLFQKAAGLGGNRPRSLYYQAKSLARADLDDDALDVYKKVSTLGGEFADHASYQLARLNYILSRFEAAITAYDAYKKSFPRGRHRSDATREYAVALLAKDQPARAYAELKQLLDVERSARIRARLEELLALAALNQGHAAEAETLFRKVISDRPLSLSALLAEKRLAKMGLAPSQQLSGTPPRKDSPEKTSVRSEGLQQENGYALSLEVERLDRYGMSNLAEEVQIQEEAQLKKKHPAHKGEALCKTYEKLEAAKRQFQIAQWAARWDDLKKYPQGDALWHWLCIYPRPYLETVLAEAKTQKLDPAFVYAIMRQESAFRPEVVSPAQAVGLMQIIPPTARQIASALHVEYQAERMRLPGVNIQFGAYYLAELLQRFEGNLVLAAAGYNAGPYAAARWLRSSRDLPLDLFVAKIPYGETRNYVYRVMGNYARYRLLLNPEEEDLFPLELELPKGEVSLTNAY